jgi:hypothetical protein
VRERLIAETRRNPLALLELPHGLRPAELAGGFAFDSALPLPCRIEESFRQRVERLPAESRRLLLVAAAEPIGDPRLLWVRPSASISDPRRPVLRNRRAC